MTRKLMGLILGATLLGTGSAQAGVLIDNFDTAQANIVRTTAGTTCTSASGIGILGGTRELCLTLAAGGSGLGANAQVLALTPAFGGTSLNLNNNAGEDATVSLEYDGLGGVDINTDPATGDDKPWLIFRVQSLDHDLKVIVELEDSAGETAINTYIKLAPPITDRCNPDGVGPATEPCPAIVGPVFGGVLPGNYYHAWDLFKVAGVDPVTGAAFGGHNAALNLDSLERIKISFATAGGEIELLSPCIYSGGGPTPAGAGTVFDSTHGLESTQCNVVPEPASLLLLGTGMLGLGLFGARSHFSRRRRQA